MITVLIIVSVLVLLLAITTAVLFKAAFVRRGERMVPWEREECFRSRATRFVQYGDLFFRGREWLRTVGCGDTAEELTVTSFDGLRLCGRMLRNPSGRGIVLMCHGYRSNPIRDFSASARALYDEGFSLLMIDQRAHGGSEGKYISYGVDERFDIRDWCRLLDSLYPGEPIVLYGMSMGATAVMLATGLSDLPANVRACVADCGFTSPREILGRVMWKRYHVPVFPVYHLCSLLTRLVAGFSLSGTDTWEALSGGKIPLLIVHGNADRLVPFYMGEENRGAARDAIFLPVEGADHLCAFAAASEDYTAAFRSLCDGAGL